MAALPSRQSCAVPGEEPPHLGFLRGGVWIGRRGGEALEWGVGDRSGDRQQLGLWCFNLFFLSGCMCVGWGG